MQKEIAYYDGVWGEPSQLKVPLEERGFIFGEGVYEVVLAYNHVFWGLEDHLDRLEQSLMLMEMAMPMPRQQLKGLLDHALAMVSGDTVDVYMQVTRGCPGPRDHSFADCADHTALMIVARDHDDDHAYMQAGRSAVLYPDLRWAHCNIKTLNLIPNAMAATAARRAGAFSAIMHRDGMVTEGAAYTVFMVKDNVLYTRPLSDEVLPSVTRKHIVTWAPKWGIDLREQAFSVEEMLAADEVYLVSTTKHPMPIVEIDGHVIGDGKVGEMARRIYQGYEAEIAKACGPLKR